MTITDTAHEELSSRLFNSEASYGKLLLFGAVRGSLPKRDMKSIHMLALASTVVSVCLLFLGAPGLAGVVLGLSIIVEIIGSILLGKQSNEGLD